jgi:hypothetical protein
MRHYEVGEWADFARDLVPNEERMEMERHLASGCSECGSMLAFLRKVGQTASTEHAYESATSVLSAAARRVFAKPRQSSSGLDRAIAALQTLIARLTYDSSLDLQPAGARALRGAGRQLLFEAGDFSIDLRVDRERDSMQMTLVGQIANQKGSESRIDNLPVLLLSGEKIVTQTTSNEFGEFFLEYVPRRNMRISVPVQTAGVRLEVPLKRLVEENEA